MVRSKSLQCDIIRSWMIETVSPTYLIQMLCITIITVFLYSMLLRLVIINTRCYGVIWSFWFVSMCETVWEKYLRVQVDCHHSSFWLKPLIIFIWFFSNEWFDSSWKKTSPSRCTILPLFSLVSIIHVRNEWTHERKKNKLKHMLSNSERREMAKRERRSTIQPCWWDKYTTPLEICEICEILRIIPFNLWSTLEALSFDGHIM